MSNRVTKSTVEQVIGKVKEMKEDSAIKVVEAALPAIGDGKMMAFAVSFLAEAFHMPETTGNGTVSNRNAYFYSQAAVLNGLSYKMNDRRSRIDDRLSPLKDQLRAILEANDEKSIESDEILSQEFGELAAEVEALNSERVVVDALFNAVRAEALSRGHREEYYREQYVAPRGRGTAARSATTTADAVQRMKTLL